MTALPPDTTARSNTKRSAQHFMRSLVRWRPVAGAIASALTAAMVLGACSGGDGTGPKPTPSVSLVEVAPATASLRVGETRTLVGAVTAANGASMAVTWSSEAASVASVSAAGVVTALTPGTATVRATSVFDSRVSGTAQIQVTALRSIILTPATATIGTGEQRTLVADIQLAAGENRAVTWRTSDASRVSVSQAGVVTGVAVGSATISVVAVIDTNVRATAVVIVAPVIQSVSVSPTTANLFINDTQQLTPTVTAQGGLATAVTWRTSNSTVATVNASGVVTALAFGQATITAVSTVDTTKRASAAITIGPRPLSVAIVQRNVGINPGSSTQLTVNVGADPGTSTAVNWASSTPAVATVSATGVVSAIAAGSTLISATSQADATKRDTVTVTVVQRLANTWSSTRLGGALFEDIISIASFGANSAFGVNVLGDIYRWNGTTWTLSTRGSTLGTQFESLHGTSATSLLAVGSNGVIARFDGTAWTRMTSPVTSTLYNVFMDGPTSAFAVGANGVVLRLTGTTWTALNSGSTRTLYSVWSSGTSAMMVGSTGEILRYEGSTFTRMEGSTSEALFSVSGSTINALVAVGASGTVLRFDGTAWTLVNSSGITNNLWAAVAGPGGRFYLIGDDGLFALDGATVSAVAMPYTARLFSGWVESNGTVWTGGQRGLVQRGVPSASSASFETINIAPDLLDVWTTAANNSWAVGEFGWIQRWNGTTWTRQQSPTAVALTSVWAPSATEAFAAGDNGVVLRYNGTAWTAMSFPSTAAVLSLWGTTTSNVYAVTSLGEVLRYNGIAWSVVTSSSNGLWTVFGASASDVYAGGEAGRVLRFNGTAWAPLAAPGPGTITGLWMTGQNNVLAVGSDAAGVNGISYRYNGTAWAPMPVGSTRFLTSVWGPSLADVYITGDVGTLLRFDGSNWAPLATGTTDLLWAISGSPDGLGGAFAVGYNGVIVTGTTVAGAQAAGFMMPAVRGSLEPSAAARAASPARAAARALPEGAARRLRKMRRRP